MTFKIKHQRQNPWKNELISRISFKRKESAFQKTQSRKGKDKSQTGRKYLQKIYLINYCYPEHKKIHNTQQKVDKET